MVLVHGLLHRGVNLRGLARFLNRAGRTVILYDYPTTRATVVQHGRDLADFLRTLPREPVDIVTHSMGGLLFRSPQKSCAAMANWTGSAGWSCLRLPIAARTTPKPGSAASRRRNG